VLDTSVRSIIAFLLLGCAVAKHEPVSPPEPAAFERLRAELPGRWRGEIDGHPIVVEYRVSSRGSIVLETWMPGTPAETITAYHLDRDRVMLTHYCAQGNQPRLRLVESAGGRYTFTRFDATNVAPDAGVLAELVLEIDGSTLARTDIYSRGSQREATTIVFTRTVSTAALLPIRALKSSVGASTGRFPAETGSSGGVGYWRGGIRISVSATTIESTLAVITPSGIGVCKAAKLRK
jgi:hypothetical protein